MYFNALQWQNFSDENLSLHVVMVANARCWVLYTVWWSWACDL